MRGLQSKLDEFNDLESSYDELQAVIGGISDNPVMIFSGNRAYYITHKIDGLLALLIQEREVITQRLVTLKKEMAEELSTPQNKQLKLI